MHTFRLQLYWKWDPGTGVVKLGEVLLRTLAHIIKIPGNIYAEASENINKKKSYEATDKIYIKVTLNTK